jgi:lactoylglutathione lyase
MVFIDIGDQFLAIQEGRTQPADEGRHLGLVVDDKQAVRDAVEREGLEKAPSVRGGLAFFDPWGNHLEVVDYRDVQFERTPGVKRRLGIESLEKTSEARAEIEEKGLS